MQRRRLLRRSAGLAPLLCLGLAGCQSGGDGPECPTPDTDDLEALVPGTDAPRQPTGTPTVVDSGWTETGANATMVAQTYEGSPQAYAMTVQQFPSEEAASAELEALLARDSPGYGGVAYVRVGRYVYSAAGADKSAVTTLLSSATPLTAECVDANVQWQ